jgi:hypothetical protein
MLSVARHGVVCDGEWMLDDMGVTVGGEAPARKAVAGCRAWYMAHARAYTRSKPHYRVTQGVYRHLPTGMRAARVRVLLQNYFRRSVPVVLGLHVYMNQAVWVKSVDGTHVSAEEADAQWMQREWSYPSPKGLRSRTSHAVVAYAYDEGTDTVRVRNSFGASWGCRGDFNIPVRTLGRVLMAYMAIERVAFVTTTRA